MANPRADKEITALLKVCDELGWSVTEIATGYKIANTTGQMTSISRTAGGPNRLKNILKSLESLGFSAAKAQLDEEKEAGRKQRIADDRARVARPVPPPATFVPPTPAPVVRPTPAPAPAPQTNGTRLQTISFEPGEMFTATELMTPQKAADFIARPPAKFADGAEVRQRPLDQNHVIWLAGIIERGEWQLTPQGLSVTPDGGVIDGQHRLHAVVLADQAVPMRVTYNVPAETFYAHDSNKKRTHANHLFTLGEVNTNHLNSALKTLWCWEQWQANPSGPMAAWTNWTRFKPSYPQLADVLERWPDVRDGIKDGTNMMRAPKGIPAAGAAFLVLTRRAITENLGEGSEAAHWHERLEEFTQQVQTGEMIARGNPAYTIRNWIIDGSGGGGPEKRERQLLGLLKAWRAAAIGKEMRLVKFAPNEQMILPYVPRVALASAA